MSVLLDETAIEPVAARVTRDSVIVDLQDGRTIITPIEWYPRLVHGTPAERNNIEFAALGLYWPDLDEDLSVEGMLEGRKSSEPTKSLGRWLEYRARGEKEPIPELPLSPKLARELAKFAPVSQGNQKVKRSRIRPSPHSRRAG
jgi:hypothetical protein